MDAPDSCDGSSQQGFSTSSNSQDPIEGGAHVPVERLDCRCLWKDCQEVYDDKPTFYNHLQNHALENMAGPCQWRNCKVAEQGTVGAANNRKTRHQPRFMEHHIKCHVPKKFFKCLMDGCNKAFETPERLNNHMSKHPQLKKGEKLDSRLEDSHNGRIIEIPTTSWNSIVGMEQLQRKLRAHEILRSIGISYVPFANEYYITVHGRPEGEIITKPTGRERNYRLRFPYSPAWMKEMYLRCVLDVSESRDAIITWKLPLSNPVFKDILRIFVKKVEAEFSQTPSAAL